MQLRYAGRVAPALSIFIMTACGGPESLDVRAPEPSSVDSQEAYETQVAGADAEAARPELPPVDLSVNRRPCGDDTIAVVDDDRGAIYAFCGFGTEEVATIEVLPGEGVPSRLGEASTTLELFDLVLPAGVSAPEWVRDALRDARADPAHGTFEYESPVAFAYKGSCSDPQGFVDWGLWTSNEDVFRSVADFNAAGQGSVYQLRDCVRQHEFSAKNVGWTQRTASYYERTSNGACVGGFNVRSCGGYTLMQFWSKASPSSGSWGVRASYWVPNGGWAHLRWYSNARYSCHPTYDRDDFRVTSTSQPNTNHHMVATFVNRAYDIGTGNNICEIDPRY